MVENVAINYSIGTADLAQARAELGLVEAAQDRLVDEFKKVNSEAAKQTALLAQLATNGKKSGEQTAQGLKGVSGILDRLTADYKRLEAQQKAGAARSAAEIKKLTSELETLRRKQDEVAASASKVSGGYATIGNIVNGLGSRIAAAFAIGSLTSFAASVFETGAKMESLGIAIRFASGSATEGQKNLTFLRNTSKELGLDLIGAAEGFKQILAASNQANIPVEETRKLFTSVSTAGKALNLTQADQNGLFLAFSQIISKGTVQAEELRGQIGERLPGAFGIAARSMGVTTQQLNKMLEQGQVISKDFLPKFAEEMQKTFGPGVSEALESANSSLGKFKLGYNEFLEDLFNGNNTFFTKTLDLGSKFFKGLTNLMTSDDVKAKKAAQQGISDFATVYEENLTKIARAAKDAGKNVDQAIYTAVANTTITLQSQLEAATAQLATLQESRFMTPDEVDENNASILRTKERIVLLNGELAALNDISKKAKDSLTAVTDPPKQQGLIEYYREMVKNLTKARDTTVDLTQKQADSFNIQIEKYNKLIERLTTLGKTAEKLGTVKPPTFSLVDITKDLEAFEQGEYERAIKRAEKFRDIEAARIKEQGIANQLSTGEIDKQVEANEHNHLLNIFDINKKYSKDTLAIENDIAEDKLNHLATQEQREKEAAERRLAQEKKAAEMIKEVREDITQAGIGLVNTLFDAQIEKQNEYLGQLATLKEYELLLYGDNEAKKDEVLKRYAEEEKKIRREQAELARKQAIFNKTMAVFQIALNTAQGIMKAVAEVPKFDFGITTGILVAAYSVLGALQAAAVIAQPIPKFAQGTKYVTGGQAGKDSVLAMLMPGERVITTAANKEYTPILDAIHDRKIPASFLNELAISKYAGLAFRPQIPKPAIAESARSEYDRKHKQLLTAIAERPVQKFLLSEQGLEEFTEAKGKRKKDLNTRYSS